MNPDLEQTISALTQELMLIPGTAERQDDLQRCFAFVLQQFSDLEGITIDTYDCKGSPSLFVHQEEDIEPAILLCAHLDVVDHANPVDYRCRVEDGKIIGPGAGDMKGALAILITLFKNLHIQHPGSSLGLIVTSDEETGGTRGMKYLFHDRGLRCGVAINPDGGCLNEIITHEKGALHLRFSCNGTSTHAARPWQGDNALEHLAERVLKLKHELDTQPQQESDWTTTCTITGLHTSNQASNVVPDDATAIMDIRFPAPITTSDLLTHCKETLGDRIEIEALLCAEPLEMKADPLFIKHCEKVCGVAPRLMREAGASDSRFLAEVGIPTIMSRPKAGNLHCIDEWIDIESMIHFYRICEGYITEKLGF